MRTRSCALFGSLAHLNFFFALGGSTGMRQLVKSETASLSQPHSTVPFWDLFHLNGFPFFFPSGAHALPISFVGPGAEFASSSSLVQTHSSAFFWGLFHLNHRLFPLDLLTEIQNTPSGQHEIVSMFSFKLLWIPGTLSARPESIYRQNPRRCIGTRYAKEISIMDWAFLVHLPSYLSQAILKFQYNVQFIRHWWRHRDLTTCKAKPRLHHKPSPVR